MKNKFITLAIGAGCILGNVSVYAKPIQVGERTVDVNTAEDAFQVFRAVQDQLLATKNVPEAAEIYADAYLQCLNELGAKVVLKGNFPGFGGKIEDCVRYGLQNGTEDWSYLRRTIVSELTGTLRILLPRMQMRQAAE
jgi:hypothetical protein